MMTVFLYLVFCCWVKPAIADNDNDLPMP